MTTTSPTIDCLDKYMRVSKPPYTHSTPYRSPVQRAEALELANRERKRKAEFKHNLATGAIDPCAALRRAPRSLYVHEYLTSIPRFGRVRAARIERKAQIPPGKRISDLVPDARRRLLDAVTEVLR